MIPFYQLEWHGIELKTIGRSSSKIPDKVFYERFYKEFFYKHSSFNTLDDEWLHHKQKIADYLSDLVEGKIKILSIGSGLGTVELKMTEKNRDLKIVAIEPSKSASRWLKNNVNILTLDGYFPDCLESAVCFDFVFANNIDYVFDKVSYEKFLESIIDYGVTDFLIISTAVYNFKSSLKYLCKFIYCWIKAFNSKSGYQLWGYLRSKSDHRKALKKVGFVNVSIVDLDKETIVIRAKI